MLIIFAILIGLVLAAILVGMVTNPGFRFF